MDPMVWLVWLIVGVLAGWLVGVLLHTNLERALLIDIFLGSVGALIAGIIFTFLNVPNTAVLDVESIAVPLVGALVALMLFRILLGGRVEPV